MKIPVILLCILLGCGTHAVGQVLSPHLSQHEALYTHCTSGWSADVLGEVFCAWAIENGFPVYPAFGDKNERTCTRAYEMGVAYFALLPHERAQAHLYCAIFVETGPSLLNGW